MREKEANEMTEKKTGLVMEGGAMRGMFTCGVIDVFMENGIRFDGAIGVSAGAAFGCNYKSRQIGRAIRYNKNYCRDPRFAGWKVFLKTGDIYGAKFCYETLPNELDIFDVETYAANSMEFWVVCTDAETGKAVYHSCPRGDAEDILWMRASASMPIVSRVVEIDGKKLLDGGVADSIPLEYFESIGYNRNVVILTQPDGYRKQKNKLIPLAKLTLKGYPAMIGAMADRHLRYNENLDYIKLQELSGEAFVIRPPEALEIGSIEKDPEELERVYQIGRDTGYRYLEQVKNYLDC